MSHAVVLVAIDPTDDIEKALAEQMAPFYEGDEMCRRGSRWDWYVIGGRWDGFLQSENILHREKVNPDEFKPALAFLRNRRWHENDRWGWLGRPTATECEYHDNGNGDGVGKCLFRDSETGAEIVCWKSDQKTWDKKFYDRFVKPLDPKTILIAVDYHV